MRHDKLTFAEWLYEAAFALTSRPLGQLEGESKMQLYKRLESGAKIGLNIDLGPGTPVVVTEVLAAATLSATAFGHPITSFVESQLGSPARGLGRVTVELLNSIKPTQDWVVVIERDSGDLLVGTRDWYEAEAEADFTPAKALIDILSGKREEQKYEVIDWIRAATPAREASLYEAIETAELGALQQRLDRERQVEARMRLVELAPFCTCGECETCLGRGAQVSAEELTYALQVIWTANGSKELCPECLMTAQELVLQERTRTAVEAVEATARAVAEAEAAEAEAEADLVSIPIEGDIPEPVVAAVEGDVPEPVVAAVEGDVPPAEPKSGRGGSRRSRSENG